MRPTPEPQIHSAHAHRHAPHDVPDGTGAKPGRHEHANHRSAPSAATADPHRHHRHLTPTADTGADQRTAEYTCPMHPEIRQVGPGSCPICGMALEPLLATAEAGPNPELADMTRRFWVAAALTIPVVALEMGRHFLGLDRIISQSTSNWLQLLFATPVVLWAGWPFFVRGWNSLATRNL